MTNLVLASGQITNHDEITMPGRARGRQAAARASALAATPYNSRRHPLPGCSRGDHPDHRRIRYRPGTVQADGK